MRIPALTIVLLPFLSLATSVDASTTPELTCIDLFILKSVYKSTMNPQPIEPRDAIKIPGCGPCPFAVHKRFSASNSYRSGDSVKADEEDIAGLKVCIDRLQAEQEAMGGSGGAGRL